MKKEDCLKALMRIQSELGLKQFGAEPNLPNIFYKLKELQNCKAKFDSLADIVVDWQFDERKRIKTLSGNKLKLVNFSLKY